MVDATHPKAVRARAPKPAGHFRKGIDMKEIIAVVALGVTGAFGVAACGTAGPTASAPGPSAAPADNTSAAREIAAITVGKGGLAALGNGGGQAITAYCDPSTVSHEPDVGGSASAACGINYSDASVWKQTVTVIFDSHGHPAADSANLGTEVLQPASGQL